MLRAIAVAFRADRQLYSRLVETSCRRATTETWPPSVSISANNAAFCSGLHRKCYARRTATPAPTTHKSQFNSALAGIDRASVITQIYPNGADLFVHMERDPLKALLVLTFSREQHFLGECLPDRIGENSTPVAPIETGAASLIRGLL